MIRPIHILAFLLLGTSSLLAQETLPGVYTPKQLVLTEELKDIDVTSLKITGKEAIFEAVKSMANDDRIPKGAKVGIVPLGTDLEDYFSTQFEDAFTEYVRGAELYTRNDKDMQAILGEVGFTQSAEDSFDPKSIEKLALKGLQYVIKLRFQISPPNANSVRSIIAGFKVFKIATGQNVMGREVIKNLHGPLTPDDLVTYAGIAAGVIAVLLILRAFMRAAKPR